MGDGHHQSRRSYIGGARRLGGLCGHNGTSLCVRAPHDKALKRQPEACDKDLSTGRMLQPLGGRTCPLDSSVQ